MAVYPPSLTKPARAGVERRASAGGKGALDAALFYGLISLLIFGPLAFGAVEEWSTLALKLGAAVLFLLWMARQLAGGEISPHPSPLFIPMALFAAIVLAQMAMGWSAYPWATRAEAELYAAYAALFFLAMHVLEEKRRLLGFALILTVFGFALSVFAIIQDFTFNGKIYWSRIPRFGGAPYGPYVNHNHYAGLMEMLAALPLMLCATAKFSGAQRVLLAFAGVIMTISIFLSGSRGGVIALVAELLVIAIFILLRRRKRIAVAGLLLVLAVTAGLAFSLASERLLDHFAGLAATVNEPSAHMRLTIARDGLKMVAAKPLLGWGMGTFPYVYPAYRSFYTDLLINQAHNDYLQILVETGALGLLAALGFLVLLYRAGLRNLRLPRPIPPSGKNPVPRGGRGASSDWDFHTAAAVSLAALAGCTGIVVHSLSDFNLHIPANAALFYVLCAAAATKPGEAGGPEASGSRAPKLGVTLLQRTRE